MERWIFGGWASLDSRGVVHGWCSTVKVSRCQGVKVRWCGDTFHPPEKLTLYLKVTPFDRNTPTHFHTKVPIGGYVRRCQTPKLHRSLIIKLNSLLPFTSSRLNANAS